MGEQKRLLCAKDIRTSLPAGAGLLFAVKRPGISAAGARPVGLARVVKNSRTIPPEPGTVAVQSIRSHWNDAMKKS